MKDIESREDIILFVDRFYSKVDIDPVLGPIFNERAGVDWDEHKQKLYGFWNSIVFQTGEYKGQPFGPHLQNMPLYKNEFQHWLNLFIETLDELFSGETVEKMKKSAQNIANVLMVKLGIVKGDILKTVE